jgi:hypothetical protein
VHETPAVPAERAHVAHRHARSGVAFSKRLAVEAGPGVDAQIRAAQGDQCRYRRRDIHDSRSIQGQLDAFVVFVLLDEAQRLTRRAEHSRQRHAGAPSESHNPK